MVKINLGFVYKQLLFYAFLAPACLFSQNIDSLKQEWEFAGNDYNKKLEISGMISHLYFNVHLDSLEKYSKIQIKLAKKLGDDQKLELGYSAMGSIFFRRGKVSESVYYYNKAKKLAQANDDKERLFSVSVNLASLNVVLGRNYQALRNYFIARSNLYKIKEHKTGISKAKLKKYEAQINLNIGIAYFNINDYKNATRFYSEALSRSIEIKDTMVLAKSYTNLGEIELMEQNYNVAEDFLFRGKKLKERIQDSISLKMNYLLIGKLYLEMGRFKEALLFFNETARLLKKFSDISAEKKLNINLGSYYLRQNRVQLAIEYLDKAKELNTEEYSLKDEIDVNQLLSESHFQLKNYEKANLYREIYEGIRDSIYNSETNLEIARLEMYYNAQYEQLQDSIRFINESKKKVDQIRIKEVQNFYLILWLVFLAIAFGAIVYVLGIVRKRNKELRRSINEKEALMKEVHHRVKNNFQIISSLLNIQANKISSTEFHNPMLNMQNRILAMSLVHEKLYVSEFREAVDINDYFQDLGESIKQSLLSNKSRISINNEGEDFLISLEKAIPLGLIVNELITNSIKYGSKGGGEVNIQLNILKQGDQISLVLQDDGVGFPADFNPEEFTESIGLELVFVLVDQLDGEITFENNNGAKTEVKFSI